MSNKRVRVVHGHSDTPHRHFLFYPGKWRDNPDVEYRDAIGRRNNGTWYRWLPLICAIDQECPARVLVRLDVIEEIADAALEGR